MICPACSVTIEDGVIITSYNRPISPEQFRQKCCQYAKKEGCINPYKGAVSSFNELPLSPKTWELYHKTDEAP
jgi:hypothetical protein